MNFERNHFPIVRCYTSVTNEKRKDTNIRAGELAGKSKQTFPVIYVKCQRNMIKGKTDS